jgi:hypothetical protein
MRSPRRSVDARVIHVTSRATLAAMGLSAPFAYYVAEVPSSSLSMRASAYAVNGALIGRATLPGGVSDAPGGWFSVPGRGCDPPRLAATPPRLVHTRPPAAARKQLAVLRRPQRPSDLLPRFHGQTALLTLFASTIEVDAVRRLGPVPGGGTLYLVPLTMRPFVHPVGPGCLRTLTPDARLFERRRAAQERAFTRGLRFAELVFRNGPRGPSAGGGAGGRLDDILHHPLRAASFGNVVYDLVPDRVARVALTFADGTRRTVAAHDNYWAVSVPVHGRPPRLTGIAWLAADGTVIRRAR